MAIWIALAAFVGGLVVGLVVAVVKGLKLWRRLKATRSTFSAQTTRLTTGLDQIGIHLDRASRSSDGLRGANERLGTARAALAVQLAAVREARALVGRVFWFLPGR